MALSIPKTQYSAFELLLSYPEETLAALFEGLKSAEPRLISSELASQLVLPAGISRSQAREILGMLSAMFATRVDQGRSITVFLEDLDQAATQLKTQLNASEENWTKVRSFLERVLALDNSLGITSKAALVLLGGSNHSFVEGRIFSSIRPIFGEDPAKRPVAAVIVHDLKLEYVGDENERKIFFVSLSASDLEELRKQIDRALLKEESLKEVLKKAGMLTLEEGE